MDHFLKTYSNRIVLTAHFNHKSYLRCLGTNRSDHPAVDPNRSTMGT